MTELLAQRRFDALDHDIRCEYLGSLEGASQPARSWAAVETGSPTTTFLVVRPLTLDELLANG
jgi:hypothetical protein